MKACLARCRTARGFSAPETAAVMALMSVLTATAAPNLQEFLRTAELTKARGDLRVIAVSMVRLNFDVGALRRGGSTPVALLVGPGRAPEPAMAEARPWAEPSTGAQVDTLDAHLVTNAAGYPTGSRIPRWRGPYVERLSPDPWGGRYAVNATFLRSGSGSTSLALSAGPNGIVETPFQLIGLTEYGDDLVALIGSGH